MNDQVSSNTLNKWRPSMREVQSYAQNHPRPFSHQTTVPTSPSVPTNEFESRVFEAIEKGDSATVGQLFLETDQPRRVLQLVALHADTMIGVTLNCVGEMLLEQEAPDAEKLAAIVESILRQEPRIVGDVASFIKKLAESRLLGDGQALSLRKWIGHSKVFSAYKQLCEFLNEPLLRPVQVIIPVSRKRPAPAVETFAPQRQYARTKVCASARKSDEDQRIESSLSPMKREW